MTLPMPFKSKFSHHRYGGYEGVKNKMSKMTEISVESIVFGIAKLIGDSPDDI